MPVAPDAAGLAVRLRRLRLCDVRDPGGPVPEEWARTARRLRAAIAREPPTPPGRRRPAAAGRDLLTTTTS